MQRLTLFMILAVTTFPYLTGGDQWGRAKILPGVASLVPEVLGALAAVIVVALGARDRFRYVRPPYWIAFGTLLVVIICGVLVNGVGTGPIFAGLRLYLRAIPWFLLPAVVAFSEPQIRRQALLLVAICLVQVPLAIEQRIRTADRSWGFVAVTGDWTTGTMGDAGVLSIFLVAATCVLIALYVKKQLGFWRFVLLFLVILVPTTINETKAMVLFLPVGLLAAIICASDPGTRLKKMLAGIGLLVVFGSIFVPVYDAMNADREYGSTLGDFFSNKENIAEYVGQGPGNADKAPGRVTAITYPLQRLSRDPVHLAFGYGIGNVSTSNFGEAFSGQYAKEYTRYLQGAFSRFVLELGLLGVLCILVIYALIVQDCLRVARSGRTFMSALAGGWVGVVAVVFMGMFYALIEAFPAISFLFWYISGLVAAERMRISVGPGPVHSLAVAVGSPSTVNL